MSATYHKKWWINQLTIIPKNIIESSAPFSADVGCKFPVEFDKTGITNETEETSTESDDNAQPQTEERKKIKEKKLKKYLPVYNNY